MTPFDFIKSINQSKADLMTGTENDTIAESSYIPFVVNKSLSYFPDTILHANEMNMSRADNKLQYHYLLNNIRPAKRFAKWVKREDDGNIEVVKQFYGYSTEKAVQALSILTDDNLHYIKRKLQSGGTNDQNRVTSRSEVKNG